ncbi:SrfA family protein [Moellerella wisconsensis]|uniref:SrfA family protein n=1 Tax=Moellerella wisconsensis TaxID=158849 RepID=A0A9Q8Q115_9GAMM|nr:SrfA family protein [Moellerella wisconsensis]UNH31044.1 SrfA family protein [Moellerella wisconsensis]
MTKVFLRNGKLENYLPMGENGQAVYVSALQLRETLRLRNKTNIANCLGIPQPNETGDRIDWYSPIDGQVIPWSAATEQEQQKAYHTLKQNQDELQKFSQDMQQRPHTEQQLFGALLGKTIQFPDKEHIFIVNGQPVITFWGFVNANNQARPDPVSCLKPPVIAPAVSTTPTIPTPLSEHEPKFAPQPRTVKRRSRWFYLWWLFPLLLLLLAFFLLRSCLPSASLPTVTAPELPQISRPSVELNPIDLPRISTENNVAIPTPQINTIGVPLPENISHSDNNTVISVPTETAASDHPAVPDAIRPTEALDPAHNPIPPVDVPNTPKSIPENTPLAANNSPILPPDEPNVSNGSTHSLQETVPLTIPADALATNSTKFLNGQWHAGAGIQDKNTGKPLSLNYQIKDGQGEVVMTRGDGVTCKSPVSAGLNRGALNINNQSQAQCSDGSRYLMPNVVCQPGAKSIADCQGHYENNQTFPMSIKRENN